MQEDDLDTDTKLAILSSVIEGVSPDNLLEALLAHAGDVDQTVASLSQEPAKRLKFGTETAIAVENDSIKYRNQLKWTDGAIKPKRKIEAILELGTPSQIENILPCALITDVLPQMLAKELLNQMLNESTSWKQGYFKLFDRTVTSPHVAGFYLQSADAIRKHKRYVYNGQEIQDINVFTEHMQQAHTIIESRTRQWLRARSQTKEDYNEQDWKANVAFANLYDGRASAVGYHSDQLTYLGPLPTIASLSLGCEREFRLKPVGGSGNSRTIAVRLPHNSLFIMGPGCQEDYKHSIHPVAATKGLDIHPIAGVKRINITYRQYRDEYAPGNLPKCPCGQTVLRSAKPSSGTERPGDVQFWHGRRYFWHCDGDKNPEGAGCGYFKWASFTKDGAPILPP